MFGWRVLVGAWRRFSFTARFMLILAVMGVLIAAVPLILAGRETRASALSRATDHIAITREVVDSQKQALATYVQGVATQIDQNGPPPDTAVISTQLLRDSQDIPGDVVGVVGPQLVLCRTGVRLAADTPIATHITNAVQASQEVFADADGKPWMLATRPLSQASAVVLVARPITRESLNGIAVVRNGLFALDGSIGATVVAAGGSVPAEISVAVRQSSDPQIIGLNGAPVAVATTALGNDFVLVVAAPVTNSAGMGTPEFILLGLVLIAMIIIVTIVQGDLQRPLRRLDRAVAGLSRSDFDIELPMTGTDDEIGRLAKSFDRMRRELRATLRSSRARAVIATELNAPQPLQTALEKVCAELREATDATSAVIVIGGSEMTDSFVVGTGRSAELDAEALLSSTGPIGTTFRRRVSDASIMGALPSSFEARSGLHLVCAAPLAMRDCNLGVVAITPGDHPFASADASLVASTAEQIALSLERYRFLALVQRQASIDDLTGLHNHRFFVDYLGQQVALAERLDAPLALMMLDLDHFKRINDTHGHPTGDSALQMFAATIAQHIRRSDLAARYGGEEFVVVMPNTGRDNAARVAEKIRAAVSELEIPLDGGRAESVTVSIGVAAFPEDTTAGQELLAIADAALYQAKDGGRNRVVLATGRRDASSDLHLSTLSQDSSVGTRLPRRQTPASLGSRR